MSPHSLLPGPARPGLPDATRLTRYVARSCDSTRLARVPRGRRTRPITEGLRWQMPGDRAQEGTQGRAGGRGWSGSEQRPQ